MIPTYNAGAKFRTCAEMLVKQTANIKQVLIIDSQSKDETVEICKDFGFTVEIINKKDFGHGKTRQYALEKATTEIVVFMTQDARLVDKLTVERLVSFLESDNNIAAVYGRQIPYEHTNIIGQFARIYNYPTYSHINKYNDKSEHGIKTAFFSDTFSAYRKPVLMSIGGFPKHLSFGEDMYVAARLLLQGFFTGYCADAVVYHSHDYSILEEFSRCREIGKFHRTEVWLLENFGKVDGEGFKYVREQFHYFLRKKEYLAICKSAFINIIKFIGYKVGYWGL